jgi:autotransporter-associated beta strand protein
MTNAGDGQIGSAGSGTVSGNISGSVPLVTSGSGSITLSGSNTYSGGLNVYQGTTTLLNNQAGATGGVLMCTNNANGTTLNLGSSSQVSPTLVAAGSGNLFQMGTLYPAGAANSSAQTLNVNGASGFPTTVTNASPLVVARASTLTIGNYATWNQSGGLNVAAYGGFGATLYVGNGAGSSGILNYSANSPIQLSEYNICVSPSILNINGGMLITGQPFNFNGASTTAGDVGRLCIYNGGMLTLSANIPQLTTGDPSGQVQLPTASVGIINTAGYSTTLGTGVTGSGSLLAIGSGTLTLAGTNTYTGTTVISNSTLVVAAVGVVPTNAVTVATNATLGGSGIVTGVTTVQAGGSLAPGVGNGTNTATLTFSNSLFMGGNLLVNLNKSLAQSNDLIVVKGSVLTNTAAGILTVTNYGPALVVGDTFTLFSQAVSNGAALSIVGGSPAGYAVTWTNKLAVNGSISVLAVTATASTNALLTSLVLSSAATFTPAFSSNITSYAATENYGNSPTVTVINGNLNATNQLIYNGSPVGLLTSGVPSGALTLTLGGTNVINVKVTAQNGTTTNLYTVNVVEIPSQSQPQLTNSFNGTALTFSWPADHLGYRLLVQTNNLQNGVSGVASDWGTVAGSQTNTTTTITVPTTNLNEFYKLVYP